MKKLAVSVLAFVTLLSFSGCYKIEENTVVKTISANGSNEVLVEPDLATLVFSVTTSGWSAKNICIDNDTISNRFIEAVKKIGISEEEILKSDCTISNPGNVYESRRNIEINVKNLSLVPQVIDCKSASIKLKSSEYKIQDVSSYYRQTRINAIKNAQDVASLYAGASGTKITNISSIYDLEMKQEPTNSGKIKISASVAATFEIQ